MDSVSYLRLFLRESRSLAHRAHQSESHLRCLAASVELDYGLADDSRLNERLGLGQRGHRLVTSQDLKPLHEVAGRLKAVSPVHHADNLRVTVLEHRLAHAHQRLDVPRLSSSRDAPPASFSQSARASCKAPGMYTTVTCTLSASCVLCNVPPCVSKS